MRPTLIEAVQYRYGAHTTADDPSVYRDDEQVERAEGVDGDPSEMFEYTYADRTPRLEDQRDYLADLRERHGDDTLLEDE